MNFERESGSLTNLVEAGAAVVSTKGFLIQCVVIPRPHKQVVEALL
jgi:microcompartment protein CcmL/EutN